MASAFFNEAMKTLIVSALAFLALSGCAIVPYEPAPVVYAAPPPPAAVVVRPYYYGGYYRGGAYWRRGWR
jgi:hypothetical protein